MDTSRTEGKSLCSSLFCIWTSTIPIICKPNFVFHGKRKETWKVICIWFPYLGMLFPDLRASIAVKLIYPANSHVEQQIAFLPKWIECIQSNHHPAEEVQNNVAWLLCLLFISLQLPISSHKPQEHPFHLDPLLFLTLKWNVGICLEDGREVSMSPSLWRQPNWCWGTPRTTLS